MEASPAALPERPGWWRYYQSSKSADSRKSLAGDAPAQGPQMTVTYQFSALLIPQTEGKRFEAWKQGHRFYHLKERLGFMALLQVVIGDSRAQVMNMVKADVSGKP